jgi:hypothetical protein
MLSRILLAAALVAGLSTALLAQNPVHRPLSPQQQQQQQQQLGRQQVPMQPVEIRGVLEGVTRDGIVVSVDGTNQRCQIAIPATAKVEVTGKTTADNLQTGQIVEFQAEIEDHLIKEEIAEITVVSASKDHPIGVFPAGGAADQAGVAGGEGGGKSAKALANGTYRIVGKLTVGHGSGGKFSVLAGRKKLSFSITDQAAVTIHSADFSIAAAGDKVTAKAMMMQSRKGQIFQAAEVTIELAAPQADVKKKGPASKPEAKRPPKGPKKDEGLPEPAADQ